MTYDSVSGGLFSSPVILTDRPEKLCDFRETKPVPENAFWRPSISQFLLRFCSKGFLVATIALNSTFATVNAAKAPLPEQDPTASPVQSPARPHGFQIRGPVMLASSDARSAHFTNNYLQPIFQQASAIVKSNVAFNTRSDHKLDASKLFLIRTTKYPVRV